jgi:hypothetical protein
VSVLDNAVFPTSPPPRSSEHDIEFTPEDIITSPLTSRNVSYDNCLNTIAQTLQERTTAKYDDDARTAEAVLCIVAHHVEILLIKSNFY